MGIDKDNVLRVYVKCQLKGPRHYNPAVGIYHATRITHKGVRVTDQSNMFQNLFQSKSLVQMVQYIDSPCTISSLRIY